MLIVTITGTDKPLERHGTRTLSGGDMITGFATDSVVSQVILSVEGHTIQIVRDREAGLLRILRSPIHDPGNAQVVGEFDL